VQRLFLPALLTGLAIAAAVATTSAAPLDEEACTQLKQELQLLESRGTRTNMANGPGWAKANLAKDKLEEIKSLIEIEEALTFRCPQPKPKAKAEKTAAGAAAAGKSAPTGKRTANRAKKDTDGEQRRQQTKPKAKPVEKAKAKPKPDDSYRPPALQRKAAPQVKPATDASAGKSTAARPQRPAQSAASPAQPAFKNPFTPAN
jgi:hypothetical protein